MRITGRFIDRNDVKEVYKVYQTCLALGSPVGWADFSDSLLVPQNLPHPSVWPRSTQHQQVDELWAILTFNTASIVLDIKNLVFCHKHPAALEVMVDCH